MPVAIPSRRYFEALELEPDHTGEEETRAAYKKLALKWHPDRHTTEKEDAQQKFIEINEAYTVLLEYFQHRRRGSPHPAKRHHRDHPDTGASSREHRSEGRQRPPSQTHNDSDAHSTRSSSHRSTDYSTPPSSPQSSTRSKLHKDRPHRDDSRNAGRHSTSSRSDLRDGSQSGRHSHSKERGDARTSPYTPEDPNHDASAGRHPRDEGRRQHPSRSRDNLRAQSPGQHTKDAHPPSPHSPTRPHHGAEAYFTWPRKRPARQRSDDSSASQRRPGFFPKRSKLDVDPRPDTGTDVIDYDFINLGTPIAPLRSPHHASDDPRRDKDWTFPLQLSLADLYHARAQHYRITRTLRGGGTESVKIPIPVDPAWRTGTRMVVPGMGNERVDGSFQDIVFVVAVEPHPRFARQGDDLDVAVQVPWEEPAPNAAPHEDQAYVFGLDGEEFALPIPRSLADAANGTRIVGAGMPVMKGRRMIGKGDLLVRWEFIFEEGECVQPSRWQNMRKAMGWHP